ncbi:MAG TPA: lysylphosphatidylglycerol synthase transmembrane domain-containing protein, partial [Actinomycetota bacterium]|nr:lysylphosphatidylglycerol synthase transmembrane domain-containing protein [Actinomycetota bacterium]
VTLLAERAGVSVFPVIAAGLATGRDALLVIETKGELLIDRGDQGEGAVDDGFLRSAWGQLAKLHDAGIAHGQVDAYRLAVLPDGTAALLDFGDARVAASDSFLLADQAQLLVTSTLLVGKDRAVAVAADAIGNDGLAAILPFLQPPALTRTTRRTLRERDLDLDGVRDLAAKTAGVEVPKLEQIRRVTLGSVLMVALIVFLAYAIISAISGVGLQNLVDELEGASGPWLWIALVVSPLMLVPQAIACMGATERPVRLGPLVALEAAIQFIQLAVPSSAARIALNIRFFQRAGATTTAAVAIGMIDGFSGFCVEILLLLSISLTGLGSLNLKPDGSSQSFDWTLIVIAGVVIVIAAAVALAIPRVRTMLKARVADSRVALRVFHSPTKVAMLFFGNLTVQLLMALILGLCLKAFGYSIGYADLILIVTAVQLFAGFMPVPGGIGVAEAAYTACLVAAGIPQTAALATALTMRLVTYYLPPVWGGFGMRWLRHHSYI